MLAIVALALGAAPAQAETVVLTAKGGKTKFKFSLTNTDPKGSRPVNAFTLGPTIYSNQSVTGLTLNGYPANSCGQTGVQGAIGCNVNIAPGGTVTGSGTTQNTISPGDMYKVFWSQDGFATIEGQADVTVFKLRGVGGLPSHTRITKATINKKKHRATFVFTARGATGFQCVLVRQQKYRGPKPKPKPKPKPRFRPCTSPTTYNNLKPGKYAFEVRGVNSSGVDPRTQAHYWGM